MIFWIDQYAITDYSRNSVWSSDLIGWNIAESARPVCLGASSEKSAKWQFDCCAKSRLTQSSEISC